jgi:Icc-related predicted phosphoesterase
MFRSKYFFISPAEGLLTIRRYRDSHLKEFLLDPVMRFLIVGDLHGAIPKIQVKEFDAIIAPGDFCSDELRTYDFISEMIKRGMNPFLDYEWYDIVGRKKAKEMVDQSVLAGRKILQKLNSFGKPVYIVPGNWDWTLYQDSDWEYLRKDHYGRTFKGLSNVKNLYHRSLDIGEFVLVGHGIYPGPEFPQHEDVLSMMSKGELVAAKKRYKRIFSKVGPLVKKAKKPVIFLTHNVPFNTPLDMITDKRSTRYGLHYGSVVAREVVDKYQPLVCIGGHMHEHFGKCMLGETTCINAGFGAEVNVLVEIKGGKVIKTEFWKKGKKVKESTAK